MHIVEETKKIERFYGRVSLTIGNFEGFHQGHLRIIRTLVRESKNRSLVPSVLTFKQHPISVLFNRHPEKLSAPCDKIKLLEKEGIELLLYVDFTRAFADLDPLSFLSNLKSWLAPRLYCLGQGFKFGRGNKGNVLLLEQYTTEFGYELVKVDDVQWDGHVVSSTRIRNEVKNGNFVTVQHLLGKRYYAYLTCTQKAPPVFSSFFSDWALPERGRFTGCIEDIRSGNKFDTEMDVSQGIFTTVPSIPISINPGPAVKRDENRVTGVHHQTTSGLEGDVQPGRLYRFYFSSGCE